MLFLPCGVEAQTLVRDNGQQQFKQYLSAGNYSGITQIGVDTFAIVDDKAEKDGYRKVKIDIDSVSGRINGVTDLGYVETENANRDMEGIAFLPARRTIMTVGEADSKVVEYALDGTSTGRQLQLEQGTGNASYESLAYDAQNHRLWTCTEGPLERDEIISYSTESNGIAGAAIRLQAFNDNLQPLGSWLYATDAPRADRTNVGTYAFGVSELLPYDEHNLLVLEREAAVPKSKIGAWVVNKIYKVCTDNLLSSDNKNVGSAHENAAVEKQLVCEWKTQFPLFGRSFANYEGMCMGPQLADGSHVIILVADSQAQAYGVLRDWFRTIVVR